MGLGCAEDTWTVPPSQPETLVVHGAPKQILRPPSHTYISALGQQVGQDPPPCRVHSDTSSGVASVPGSWSWPCLTHFQLIWGFGPGALQGWGMGRGHADRKRGALCGNHTPGPHNCDLYERPKPLGAPGRGSTTLPSLLGGHALPLSPAS